MLFDDLTPAAGGAPTKGAAAPVADSGGLFGDLVPAQATTSERGMGDIFGSAISRGWSQNVGLLTEALPALAYSVAGNEAEAQRKLGEYQARLAEIAKTNPAVIESFSKIGSLGDAVTYLAEAVGENLPSMVPGLGGAGLGALAGRTIAKSAAGTAAGMTAGAVAGSAVQNIPETFADVAQETGQQRPGVAMAFGGLKAGLDAIPSVMALKRAFGPAITDKIAGNILKRMGVGAAEQFAAEGATEAGQEALDIAAARYVDENRELFTKENLVRIADAGLKGGLGGATLGGLTGAIQRPGAPPSDQPGAPDTGPVLSDTHRQYLREMGLSDQAINEDLARAQVWAERIAARRAADTEPFRPSVEPELPTSEDINNEPSKQERRAAYRTIAGVDAETERRANEAAGIAAGEINPAAASTAARVPPPGGVFTATSVGVARPGDVGGLSGIERLTQQIGANPAAFVQRTLGIPESQFRVMPQQAQHRLLVAAMEQAQVQQPGPTYQVQDTSGQGPTSAAPAPMREARGAPYAGAAENPEARVQPTSAEIDATGGQRINPRGPAPTGVGIGGSERPFPAGPDSSGLDFGNRRSWGAPRDPEAEFFERRANEMAARAKAAQQEEMQRRQEAYTRWRQADEARKRAQNEEDLRRRYSEGQQYRDYEGAYREQTGQSRWGNADYSFKQGKYTPHPKPFDAEGNYPVDENGFVTSTGGGPIVFPTQKAAGRWILDHGNKRGRQVFEPANHPGVNGKFTVYQRGMTEPEQGPGPESGGPGPSASSAPSARPALAPPAAPNQTQTPGRPSPGQAEGPSPEPTAAAPGAAPVSPDAPQPAPDSPRGPAATKPKKGRGPASLWEFIASRGGIKDSDGELKAMGITSKRLVPGAGPLVRAQGLSYDAMREAVEEAGYIRSSNPDATTTPRDLLDAIQREMPYWTAPRGTKRKDTRIYAAEDQGEADARREARTAEEYDRREQMERAAARLGVDYNPGISDAELERLIDAKVSEMEADVSPSEPYRGSDDLMGGIPGFEPSVDRTPIGDQYVVPGAEKISDREMAERQGQKPLRSDAEQKPADEGLFDVEGRKQDGLFSRKAPGFYSALTDAVQNLSIKSAPATQWQGVINNLTTKGVKQAEIDWSMIGDWLSKKTGPITKDQVVQYLRDNEVQVEEVVRGAEDAPTKYGDYTLPGGENYRELLLTLPEKASTRGPKGWGDTAGGTSDSANFRSGHFDEPNIVAHVRFNERTDADGRRVLFIEEIQSDWHQQGKRQGYGNPAADKKALADLEADMRQKAKTYYSQYLTEKDTPEEHATAARLGQKLSERNDIASIASVLGRGLEYELALSRAMYGDRRPPDAPFKTQWPELAFKRALRWAAENGFDRVAWTTGEQQADRYNLSKQVDSIEVETFGQGDEAFRTVDIYTNGGYTIDLEVDKNGLVTSSEPAELNGKRLDEVVGKDMADKIMSGGDQIISGDGLKMGGEGMRGFYDKMLPAMASKLGKKYGAAVGKTKLSLNHDASNNDLKPWNVAAVDTIIRHGGEVYAVIPELGGETRISTQDELNDVIGGIEGDPQGYYIGDTGGEASVHSMDITPAMKASVMGRGMPMWAMGKRDRETRATSSGGDRVGATIQTRAETSDQRKQATDSLRAILRKLAGDKVDVSVVDRIVGDDEAFSDAGGYYTSDAGRRMIYIAMSSPEDMAAILRHETIHALRDLGVISAKDWRVLENQAAGWRKKYGINEAYAGLDLSQEKMNEEGIADAYAAWVSGQYKPVSVVENVFKQIRAFFEALRNWAQGNGWQTAEDVFEAIEGGAMSEAEFNRTPMTRGNAFAMSRAGMKQQANGVLDMIKNIGSVMDRLSNPLVTLPGDWRNYFEMRGMAKGEIQRIQEHLAGMRDLIGLPKAERDAALRYMTTKGAAPSMIHDPQKRAKFVEMKQEIVKLGQQLVDAGMLNEATYRTNRDSYLPRVYLKFVLDEAANRRGVGTGARIGAQGYLKQRQDIPEDVRKLVYGEIDDPGFLAVRSISVVATDLAKFNLLQKVSNNPDWVAEPKKQFVEWKKKKYTPQALKAQADQLRDMVDQMPEERRAGALKMALEMEHLAKTKLKAQPEFSQDYRQIPDTSRYGALRGMWVRKEIFNDMIGTFAVPNPDPSWAEQVLGMGGWATKATQWWKFGKVVANPPSIARNLMSGMIQSNVFGRIPFAYIPMRYTQAIQEILKNGKHWQAAQKFGIKGSGFAQNESAKIERAFLAYQKQQGGTATVRNLARFKDMIAHVVDIASDGYQFIESVGKVAVIIDAMERQGLSERDAVILAEDAQFDYSNVSPAVRYLRNSPIGMPFVTYMSKVAPQLIKTAATRPWAFFPYIAMAVGLPMLTQYMLDIDDDDLERLKKTLPKWAQETGSVYLLPFKDSAGRWHYWNAGYVLPWGQFQDAAHKAYAGKPLEAAKGMGMFGAPLVSLMTAVQTGIDPFTQRPIYNKADPPGRQWRDISLYLWSMAMPPWAGSTGFAKKLHDAALDVPIDKQGNPSVTMTQAVSSIFGISLYGLDPDVNRQKNLAQMKYEIDEIKRRRGSIAKDARLKPADKKAYLDEINAHIAEKAKAMAEYARETNVNPKLRVPAAR